MVTRDNIPALSAAINTALGAMILSASGWRGVFAASGNEEDRTEDIKEEHRIISAAAAFVFAEYLQKNALVLVGCDTRPTGKAIIKAIIPILLACGCEVRYAGVTAAPEIMAWVRKFGVSSGNAGFIYISASHNPIGHNGIKFGLTDGGVLAAEEAAKLIAGFRLFFERDNSIAKIDELFSAADTVKIKNVYAGTEDAKNEAVKAYCYFCGDVVWGGNEDIARAFKDGLAKRPLGVACDFNGSARTVSIDREFFSALGIKCVFINDRPGQIVHRIVPEGEALEPCRALLEGAHSRDATFALGYVPDCDGDRGNLVIWDDALNKARALEAQEVFALACVAELSHLVRTGGLVYDGGGKALTKAAIAVNDSTSMRIDRIAEAFGVSVFRAETGEANVVGLARKLREEGYTVRILGEGSAGGNITHPSAVRDPINTVLAIAKLLSVRGSAEKPGLFEIWLKLTGRAENYRDDFTIAGIIASLPAFVTTPAYSQKAVLRIKTGDHAILKERYQKIFLREWEERKDELKERHGFCGWEAIAYNGTEEKRGIKFFGEAGRGGLKVSFRNDTGRETACIWMRGSATEPVFRVMADVEGRNVQAEGFLLDWQRRMIMEADGLVTNK
jgi:phosphoglucomutase